MPIRILLSFVFTFLFLNGFSQRVLVIDTLVNQQDLLEYAYHYTDTSGSLSPESFNKVQWEEYAKVPSFLPSNYSHWLRYKLRNDYDIEVQKVFFIPYHHIHKVDVYLVSDSETLCYKKTGIMRSFDNKERKIIGYPFTLNLQPHSTYTVYAKYYQGYRPLRATSYLLSIKRVEQISYNSNGLLWFWRGIYVFALVISLLLYWFLGVRMFLYYFFFNLGVSLFMFAHIGDLFLLFNADITDISSAIDYTGAFLILLFLPEFLNTLSPIKDKNRFAWKWMKYLTYGMIPFVVASYIPFVRLSAFTLIIHNYIMIVSGLIYVLFLFYLVKNVIYKERNAIPLFLIYFLYIMSAFFDIILPNMGFAEDAPFVYRNLLVGSFIEVFSFMYLMAMETLNVYKHRSQLIETQKAHQKEIIYAMVNSQEAERNRTGRELHDLIGANMAIIKQRNSNKDSELYSLVTKTLNAVRNLSHGLVTPMVNDDEFVDEMKQMAHLCSTEQMQVHIYFHKWPNINNKKKTTHLYRIGQELLQNAAKHSQAQNVHFQFIGHGNNSVGIYYEDDGVGFDIEKIQKGLGLKNIINRVEILNGEIIIESKGKGRGTVVNIEIEVI